MGSELLIEYFHKYVTKKKKFYYEDALPSYWACYLIISPTLFPTLIS